MAAPEPTDLPITASMNGAPRVTRDGRPMQEATPQEWSAVFEEISAEGFEHVELSDGWITPAELTPERRAELRAVIADAGLALPSLHIQRVSVIEPGRGERNLAYGHASIDVAAEFGARTYNTGLHRPLLPAQQQALWFWTAQGPVDPVDDRDAWDLAVRRIRELGEHAGSVGMDLSLELYEDTYLGTADSAVRFVQDVGLDNVGLNPDVGNLIRLHRPVEDWRELYATTLPYANYWHAKNYQRDEADDGTWFSAIPATARDGIIDYREVIALAISLGYRGAIVCEHYGGDVLSVSAENASYFRRMIHSAITRLPDDVDRA
ncbi:sugar phosphate isomerase/epimerase family protein [Compostimonas suwonensis]|nr:sugar phosphate isomerase/epimerase family protein [Compostimonas suwonensis]